MVWIRLIWLRIGTSGGLLWTWYWTFGFHKMLGISWVAHIGSFSRGTQLDEWVSIYPYPFTLRFTYVSFPSATLMTSIGIKSSPTLYINSHPDICHTAGFDAVLGLIHVSYLEIKHKTRKLRSLWTYMKMYLYPSSSLKQNITFHALIPWKQTYIFHSKWL
jgi:hypothetical protein